MFEAYLNLKRNFGIRVKISHYIQPSNLSSALDHTEITELFSSLWIIKGGPNFDQKISLSLLATDNVLQRLFLLL